MLLQNLSIPEQLRLELVEFALVSGVQYFKTNPTGPGRRMCNLNLHDLPISQKVREFSEQCFLTAFNAPVIAEPTFGNFLGVNETGAFVNEHQDGLGPNGAWHVRLLFLLQKPEQGGMPVIDGKELAVQQGQCWINFASQLKHSSTPVVGNIPRVVLSLGSYIPEQVIKPYYDARPI